MHIHMQITSTSNNMPTDPHYDPNLTMKVLKAKPTANLQLHLAFENKLQTTQNQRFVFTDKYVSKVLDNIMIVTQNNGKMNCYETYKRDFSSSMMTNLSETLI